ncbi:unnamed protein product [Gongylonema pulchrum]|uniref:R3H domain-containing protein n=1 Tax=Gongylonema pulchrum TaxID=637853 RepID=A0A183EEL0_9BILA|nr:unnamed protein product [Gongylonema pulchrum]
MAGGQLFGFGADVGNITASATQKSGPDRTIITWEKPFLKRIEESAAEHASSLNDSEREQLQTIFEVHESEGSSCDESRTPSVILDAITVPDAVVASSSSFEKNSKDDLESQQRIHRSCSEILTLPFYERKSVHDCIAYLNSKQFFCPRRSLPVASKKSSSLQAPQISRSKMRRLSSIIIEWERAGRSSISDFTRFYSLAHRESFYCAKRKLAGLKVIVN